MYDQRWSPEWVAEEFDSDYRDLIFRGILDKLGEHVRSTPRTLLDVGCHAGRFVRLAIEAGWRAEGTEINERTATHAAARTGAPIHRLSAERLPELGKTFDAVTLTDVLEHIPEPVALLSTVRRIVSRQRVGRRQGTVRASAVAERDLARAPQPDISSHARRQSRAHQPLFPEGPPERPQPRGFRRRDRGDWSARVSTQRAWIDALSASRSTTSLVTCPGRCTHPRRSTCRRSGVPPRAPDARPGRQARDRTRSAPVGRHPDLQQRSGPPSLPDQLAASRRPPPTSKSS